MQAKDIITGKCYAIRKECYRVVAVITTRQGSTTSSKVEALAVDPEKPLEPIEPALARFFEVKDVDALWETAEAEKRERAELAEAKAAAGAVHQALAAAIGGKVGWDGRSVIITNERASELVELEKRAKLHGLAGCPACDPEVRS